jgi:type I restriction enzyme S subunit
MAVSQHIIAWLCDEDRVIPEFLLFVIYGMTGELLRLTNGSTIGTIGLGDVKSIQMALPPIAEQEAIISAVVGGKTKIDEAASKANQSIERFSEYRGALITAAVTGKLGRT